jgi:teichuronic acid exporter
MASLAPRFITPISTMVLAAVLTPSDFGTVAASTLIVAFAQIVVGLGVGQAVVQRRTLVAEAASVAFWMSLLVACVLYGVLWLSAPWLGQAYQIPQLASVIRVSGLSLLLSALGSMPTALLERELEFQRLFWVRSLRQLTYVLVSIALALLGAGVWALVLGPLAGATIETILVWRACGWSPLLSVDWTISSSLLSFSLWVLLAGFQSWLFLYADNALAGFFLGADGLGIYSLGFNISSLLPGLAISPLVAVAYPAFCAMQSDPKDVGRSLLKLRTLTAAMLFPAAWGLSAIAVPTLTLLYGNRWEGLGTVVQLLAVMPGLNPLWSLNTMAYRAVGRPDVGPKLGGIAMLVFIPLLVVAGTHGLMAFTLARFGGAFAMPLLHMLIGSRILGISIKDQLRALAIPFGLATVMFALARLLTNRLMPFEGIGGWLKLFLVIAIAALAYLLLLWKKSPDLWNSLLVAVRQALLSG